jgi:hypothetical protein
VSEDDGFDDVERELWRVVDRLNSLPLTKAAAATSDVYAAAHVLLNQTRRLDPAVPADAGLPNLAPQGLGAMVAVLGGDWLDAARASSEPDIDPVLDALVTLRRALP